VQLGLAVAVWRGVCFGIASAGVLAYECGCSFSALVSAFRRLGLRNNVFCALALCGSNILFALAVALTTACNVLVIIAMLPLACALGGLVLRVRLSRSTWAAVCVACVSTGLVFSTGVSAGPNATYGCMAALGAMFTFSLFVLLSSHLGDVSCVPAMPLSALLCIGISLASLDKPGFARPASGRDAVLLLVNGCCTGMANALLLVATQSIPAAEAALIGLLETAVSPILVYLVTLRPGPAEVPATRSIVACALIVATLFTHVLWEARQEAAAAKG